MLCSWDACRTYHLYPILNRLAMRTVQILEFFENDVFYIVTAEGQMNPRTSNRVQRSGQHNYKVSLVMLTGWSRAI